MATEGYVTGWRVFFCAPQRRWPQVADPVARQVAGRLSELLRSHGRVAGQPFLLGPTGRPDARVNAFFTSYPMVARDADTWRKYGYALGVWLNFLASRGTVWAEAAPEDVEAFKVWRMADEANPRRVAAGTVAGDLAALSSAWGGRERRRRSTCRPR